MANMADKLEHLANILRDLQRVTVAFSGGTDSTFLLAFASETPGVEARAVMASSPLMAQADRAFAMEFCESRGMPLQVLDVDPLAREEVRANNPERCYHCKRLIMAAVQEAARAQNATVCDGSNASDAHDYRPGMQALRELGIRSPLAEAGLTKQEIREAARARQLPNWDTPASACLVSRIPYGTPLTEEALERIATAEEALRQAGFVQVRVRDHGNLARIEVAPEEAVRLVEEPLRRQVDEALTALGYTYICMDLRGYRTGSLNEELEGHRG